MFVPNRKAGMLTVWPLLPVLPRAPPSLALTSAKLSTRCKLLTGLLKMPSLMFPPIRLFLCIHLVAAVSAVTEQLLSGRLTWHMLRSVLQAFTLTPILVLIRPEWVGVQILPLPAMTKPLEAAGEAGFLVKFLTWPVQNDMRLYGPNMTLQIGAATDLLQVEAWSLELQGVQLQFRIINRRWCRLMASNR